MNKSIELFRVFLNYLAIALIGVSMLSCSGTKFLQEGTSLYTGAEIVLEPYGKVGNQKKIRKRMASKISTEPNTTFLGMRPSVWMYFVSGDPSKEKGLGAWMRKKLGEKPVLLKDVHPVETARILEGNLINEGYFQSQVDAEVVTKEKKSKVIYYTKIYPPFMIREVFYPNPRDSVYRAVINEIKKNSFIKKGQQYYLTDLKSEMERIEELLEDYGFFYFDDRYLIFHADTTVGNHQVDLFLKLEKEIPEKAKRIYHLNRVNIINDFSFSGDSLYNHADTIQVKGYNYIHKREDFRPEVITEVTNLESGAIYRRMDHNYTLSHLMGLGAFQFVNIEYEESERDSSALDTKIYLTPMLKKSIQAELQAVSKSNNFVGPGLEVMFTNRNFLRGSERFQLKASSSYEYQISNKQSQNLNAFELDIESSLRVPRFISPVKINYTSSKYIPQTQFQLGFNLQNRINFFQLNSLNARFGYVWRETLTKSHEFYPIDLNYFNLNKASPEFKELLENNPILANSFQDQFIAGGKYSFTLNTQVRENRSLHQGRVSSTKDNFYLQTNVDFAGNLFSLLFPNSENEEQRKIWNQPYSQFISSDIDFRYYRKLDKHNSLATRLVLAVGYAYGNSFTLPYSQQFASGGSNSIRAFPARSIGPGTFKAINSGDAKTFFVDQRGDIKLEGNMEYRFDIIKYLKGAVFVDAGNIWVWEDADRPGGQFSEDFISELAVGTGLGVRLDFSFFVLRFDLAMPLRLPYRQEANRWVYDEIDLGSSEWRRQNLVLNVAIGYPF